MKTLFTLILALSFSLTAPAQATPKKLTASNCARGCTGSDYCTACKNCTGCKHCAKEGGSCGVCVPPKTTTKAPAKKATKSKTTKKKKK
ncbi:MAG: hypothetical protein PSV16_06095 [Flavobacterium sp.]|nr:hypothetical protein [Flavobacterium sp.]